MGLWWVGGQNKINSITVDVVLAVGAECGNNNNDSFIIFHIEIEIHNIYSAELTDIFGLFQ